MGLKSDLLFTLSGKLDGSLGGAFGQFEQKATSATNKAEAGVKRVNKEVSRTANLMREAAATAGVFEGTFGGITSRLNAGANLIGNAGLKIGLAVGGIATGAALLSAASGIQNYQARLVSATAGQKEFVAAQELTRRLAKDTRSDLGDTIQFYVRLTAATKQLGLEQRQIESIMSTVQKSIQLSGATAQESTAAVQQFVQGLSSANGLSGDEFKSLGENAVKVLQTIAAGLEKTGGIPGFDGTIQSLRDLGSQGKLTAAVLVPALEAMKSSVDDSFTRMPVTIQQSTTLMKNSLTELVIRAEDAMGILQGSANGISLLANNLNIVGVAAVSVATAFAVRYVAGLSAATVSNIAFGASQAAMLVGLYGTETRLIASAIAVTRFNTAMAALLSPTNLVTAALTLAAGAAYYFATRATDAEKAADALGVSQSDLAARTDIATAAMLRQANAGGQLGRVLDANAIREAQNKVDLANKASATARARLAATLQSGGVSRGATTESFSIANDIRNGRDGGTQAIIGRIASLEAKFPEVSKARGEAIAAALKEVVAADILVRDAMIQTSKTLAPKGGRGGGGGAGAAAADGVVAAATGKTLAQLRAESQVAAIDDGTSAIKAASARRASAIAALDAAFVSKGKVAPEKQADYSAQLTAINATYNAEVEGAQAAARAKTAAAAASRAAAAADKRDRREALADTNELQRIRDKYDNQPSRQDNVDKDLKRLRELQAELGKAILPDSLFADIEQNMRRSLIQPMIDANIAAQESLDIQTLVAAGRDADAEVLRRSLALIKQGVDATDINLNQIANQVEAERAVNREIERRNELIGIYARAAGEVQGALRNLLFDVQGGDLPKAFANAGKSLFDSFRASVADEISVKFFGNAQQDATDQMTGALDVNTDALGNLAAVIANYQDAFQNGDGVLAGGSGLSAIADKISSAASSPLRSAANDNILTSSAPVLAPLTNSLKTFSQSVGVQQKGIKGFNTATERFNQIGADFGAKIDKRLGTGIFSEIGSNLGTALEGSTYGSLSSGVASSLGIKQNGTLAALGGALGGLAGGPIGGAIGGLIGGTIGGLGKLTKNISGLGKAVGITAGIAGGIGGGLLGGAAATGAAFAGSGILSGSLAGAAAGPIGMAIGAAIGLSAALFFKKNPYADVRLSTNAYSNASSTTKARGDATNANAAAGSFLDSLTNLAGTLNATVKPNANLGAIGFSGDKFYFDPSGSGFKAKSAQIFATAEEAVAAALRSAINSGILEGLRQGTRNLLSAAGTDLQVQAAKAQKFEGVFTSLKQILDPVGAATDAVNKQFAELSSIFKEAGASADEYAKLQQLYDLQRADAIKSAGSATTAALKDYLTQLTTGSASGLSIRDREAQAKADFAPFVSDLAAGKKVDTDAYLKAAENLRITDRELFGSTQGYFDTLAQITSLTKQAIGDSENVSSLSGALKFDTAPVTDGLTTLQGTLASIGNQQVSLLNEIANLLAANSNTPSNSGGARFDIMKVNGF